MVCYDNNVSCITSGYAFFQKLQAFVMFHVEACPTERIVTVFYTPEIRYCLFGPKSILRFDIGP